MTSGILTTSGIDVRSMTVRYGSFEAVHGVDLHLADGEICALLGASGSGKSSLLRAIAGLEPGASGTVTVAGVDISPLPVHRRGLGLVFQDGQLFPHRTVTRNISYGLEAHHWSKAAIRERVNELLALIDLEGFANRPISSLSGGQAQRVALARSLAPRPTLLLLDEPLSALDRALREHLATELRRIVKESGTTALYVTHDYDEAFTVADRVGVMVDGRIAHLGTPVDILADVAAHSRGEADVPELAAFFEGTSWVNGTVVASGKVALDATTIEADTGVAAPGQRAITRIGSVVIKRS